jgi:hypothetical protein
MSSIKSGRHEKCIRDRWEHILNRPWMRSCISSMSLCVMFTEESRMDESWASPPRPRLLHRAVHCCGLPCGWFRPYPLVLLLHSMAESSLDDGTLEDDGKETSRYACIDPALHIPFGGICCIALGNKVSQSPIWRKMLWRIKLRCNFLFVRWIPSSPPHNSHLHPPTIRILVWWSRHSSLTHV